MRGDEGFTISIQPSMRKLVVLSVVSILTLVGAITMYRNSWKNQQQDSANALPPVPKSAVVVFASKNAGKHWKSLQKKALFKALIQLPFVEDTQNGIQLLEKLVDDKEEVHNFLDTATCFLSTHAISTSTISHVFYGNTQSELVRKFMKKCLVKLQKEDDYEVKSKKYEGYAIKEIRSKATQKSFYYTMAKPFFIGSSNVTLIEEVVRSIKKKTTLDFTKMEDVSDEFGSCLINFEKLPTLLGVFCDSSQAGQLHSIANFAKQSQLSAKITDHHVLFNGLLAGNEAGKGSFIHTLKGGPARSMHLQSYIPNDTAVVQHMIVAESDQWKEQLRRYWMNNELASTGFDAALMSIMQQEIACCLLAPESAQASSEKIVYIHTSAASQLLSQLEEQILIDTSAPQAIGHFNEVYEFKQGGGIILDKLFSGFVPHVMTVIDSYVVLANSKNALDRLSVHLQQGETWDNNATQRFFLERTLGKANFSVLVDIKKVWPILKNALKPSWRGVLEAHADSLKEFSRVAFQVENGAKNESYANLLVQHAYENEENQGPKRQTTPRAVAEQTFQAEAALISKPFLVRTHLHRGKFVLIQDALQQVYFLNPKGKQIWKKKLDGPIVGDVFQLDFYKNNKIQYLIATKHTLYLFDYHGNIVAGYPKKLPNDRTQFLNLIDYNRTKKYRILVADQQGNVYLHDKYLKQLDGWKPKALNSYFACKPRHFKVGGKDCMMAMCQDGTLHVMNRRGEPYNGFPMNIQAHVEDPWVLQKGRSFEEASLTFLTTDGCLKACNLKGEMQRNIDLYKPDKLSRFSLCVDQVGGNNFILMRQDFDKVVLLDDQANVLLEKAYANDRNIVVKFYDFGKAKFYVLHDKTGHSVHVFNEKGEALGNHPMEGTHEVGLLFFEKQQRLAVYSTQDKRLLKYIVSCKK